MSQAQGLLVVFLLALLLGGGSSAAAEARGVAFTQIEPGKATAAPRSAARTADQSDDDVAISAGPDPVTLHADMWPAGAGACPGGPRPKQPASLAYRARAPPALSLG